MFREVCRVLENKKVAPGHFVLKFSSKNIGKNAHPGEFVQILCSDSYEPLLPRPFSFLSVTPSDFSVLYHVVGKGTEILSKAKKGDAFNILGPLGKGFSADAKTSVISVLIGGGVGIPPLLHLAHTLLKNKARKENIHVFLGARNKSLLLCEKEFKKMGINLHLATDDGSKGRKGLVTEPLEEFIRTLNARAVRMHTCGPTPMLKAVSRLAEKYEMLCEVSVEVPMACGFGACLGCAIKVSDSVRCIDTSQRTESGHRFAIACCEGPVFPAGDIVWE